MNKSISSKTIALSFGIVTVSFLAVFYVFAWQEPTQAPPEGNAPAPINIGTEPQAKAGRISATEFYDYNDLSYYLNPSGNSNLANDLIVGGNIYSANWPTGIPSGMIAMFDTSCPEGWTRFVALDGKFARGADTYGGTGGSSAHSHSFAGTTGVSGWVWVPVGLNYPWQLAPGDHTHTFSGYTGSTSSLPPYLNVIWCKKD